MDASEDIFLEDVGAEVALFVTVQPTSNCRESYLACPASARLLTEIRLAALCSMIEVVFISPTIDRLEQLFFSPWPR